VSCVYVILLFSFNLSTACVYLSSFHFLDQLSNVSFKIISHTTASGFDGPWSPTPTAFNNLYFTLLDSVKWTKRDWTGPYQYEDDSHKLMMLPTDLVLIQDDDFKKYVSMYAADQAKFFADFSKAFNKLEELGTSGLRATTWT